MAQEVAATRTEAVTTTTRVFGRAPRVRTRADMAVLIGARTDRPVMSARLRPLAVWTKARCPWSVPVVVGGVSVLWAGRGSSQSLNEG